MLTGETGVTKPAIGEVYRDKYGDAGIYRNPRKIRIAEVLPNGVRAEVITNSDGSELKKPRFTSIMFKTLRAGYVLWEVSDAK